LLRQHHRMVTDKRRGRFAPTASGHRHLGKAMAALPARFQMRSLGGSFILRIEDSDVARSRFEYVDHLLEDLRWLGLDFDEGPYLQRDRMQHYEQALTTLRQKELLYPCFCSRAQLMAIASAPHGLSTEGPVYSGVCKSLSAAEAAEREAHKTPSLRFALPDKPVVFSDACAGKQVFAPSHGGDFIVQRADGIISYQLAVVVDDAAMGITDVLRGRDLLDSTPRQLLLYEALELTAPQFAHVPVLCDASGVRLSKRDQAHSIAAIRAAGVQAEQVIGCLAVLCGIRDHIEPVRASELIQDFSLKNCTGEVWTLTPKIMDLLTGI